MGKIKEIDPRNLGIAELFSRGKGLHISIMVPRYLRKELKLVLDSRGQQHWLHGLEDSTLHAGVRPLSRGRFNLVSGIREDWKVSQLVYGIFNQAGELLPDQYACATVTGRPERVNDILQGIILLLQ